jgi:hypothetical protein
MKTTSVPTASRSACRHVRAAARRYTCLYAASVSPMIAGDVAFFLRPGDCWPCWLLGVLPQGCVLLGGSATFFIIQ